MAYNRQTAIEAIKRNNERQAEKKDTADAAKRIKEEEMIKRIFDITPKKDLVNFLEINRNN